MIYPRCRKLVRGCWIKHIASTLIKEDTKYIWKREEPIIAEDYILLQILMIRGRTIWTSCHIVIKNGFCWNSKCKEMLFELDKSKKAPNAVPISENDWFISIHKNEWDQLKTSLEPTHLCRFWFVRIASMSNSWYLINYYLVEYSR